MVNVSRLEKKQKGEGDMDELTKALETIRTMCNSHNYCKKCPLRSYNGNSCSVIATTPDKWRFVGDPITDGTPPRLFT